MRELQRAPTAYTGIPDIAKSSGKPTVEHHALETTYAESQRSPSGESSEDDVSTISYGADAMEITDVFRLKSDHSPSSSPQSSDDYTTHRTSLDADGGPLSSNLHVPSASPFHSSTNALYIDSATARSAAVIDPCPTPTLSKDPTHALRVSMEDGHAFYMPHIQDSRLNTETMGDVGASTRLLQQPEYSPEEERLALRLRQGVFESSGPVVASTNNHTGSSASRIGPADRTTTWLEGQSMGTGPYNAARLSSYNENLQFDRDDRRDRTNNADQTRSYDTIPGGIHPTWIGQSGVQVSEPYGRDSRSPLEEIHRSRASTLASLHSAPAPADNSTQRYPYDVRGLRYNASTSHHELYSSRSSMSSNAVPALTRSSVRMACTMSACSLTRKTQSFAFDTSDARSAHATGYAGLCIACHITDSTT